MRIYIDSGSLIIANDFGAIQSVFAGGAIALQPVGQFIILSDLNTKTQILNANFATIFDSAGVAYGASVQAVAVALSKVINASNGGVGGVVVNYELFADLPLTGEIEKLYYVFGETPQNLYTWAGSFYASITGLCILQNGNSFGSNAVIGTNDNFALLFKTNNVVKLSVSALGITTLNNANTGETLAILNSNITASGSARIDLQTQSSNVLSKLSIENTGASFRINDVTNSRQFALVKNNTLVLGNTSVNSIAVDLVSSSFTSSFGNNSGAKFFVINSAVYRFVIESDNTLTVGDTPNYETLVTANNDIPNKKYVDDSVLKIGIGRIATATTTSTTLTPLTSASITVTVAGTYVANFNGTVSHSNNDINVSFVFAKNGTAVTNGLQTEAAHPSRLKSISISELFVNLVIGDIITVRWSTASNTATLTNYTFFLEK